ncbi:hypothetical protein FRC19_007123 [Serendipita sp. 401]|nr:hypothetical protein FRC19_007123 [Serendipita sp. 401]
MGGRDVVFQEQGLGKGQVLLNEQSPNAAGPSVLTPVGYGAAPGAAGSSVSTPVGYGSAPYAQSGPASPPPYQPYKRGQ